MQSHKTLWSGLLILGLILSGSVTQADDKKAGHGGHDHQKWVEELDLSAEQQKQLQEIRESYREKMKPKRSEIHEARKKLNDALKTDASEDSLRKQFGELQKMRQDIGSLHFEKILDIREILTPEQRKKFRGLVKEHRRHRKD